MSMFLFITIDRVSLNKKMRLLTDVKTFQFVNQSEHLYEYAKNISLMGSGEMS